MAKEIHSKIIQEAAKEVLSPLGIFQVGQSRIWIDDNGYYFTVIEFQPSAWSKGAYLNVGINFLWDKMDTLNETLGFDIGYRVSSHVEYHNDDENFYKKMLEYCELANERILYYRNFKNMEFAKAELEKSIDENKTWGCWNMAMFCFMNNDVLLGSFYLKQIEDMCKYSNIDWMKSMYKKISDDIITKLDDSEILKKYVIDSIIKNRQFFHGKNSFKKLEYNEIYK